VIADIAHYVSGSRQPGSVAIDAAFETARDSPGFVWIQMVDPTATELELLRAEFTLHPLAIDDAMKPHQRPKLDLYDSTMFAVLKSAQYDEAREAIDLGEYHIFAGDSFVVTVTHGSARSLAPVRSTLEADPANLAHGPGAVIHALFDTVVDEYEKVIDEVDNDLEQIEDAVFSGSPGNPSQRIYRLKRELLTFNRGVQPLSEALLPLSNGRLRASYLAPELGDFFRDVLDHVLRVHGRIDTARETLTSALAATLTQVSVRQNEDMRATAGWAAVIAVPTLIAGIWGMNFQHMPELAWYLGYPIGLGTITVSGFLTRWRLRKNGWL
jgi:magnesium transporter